MRVLVGEAARRGLTLRALAKLCDDRDPRALAKTIVAEHPRPDNVRSLASALDYPAIVAHALLGTLDGRHAPEVRGLISRAIEGRGRESLGFHASIRSQEVQSWLESQPVNVALDVGRRCVLALHSLASPDVDSDVDGLGPIVGSIVSALRANGYNVFPFVHSQQSADAKATLALEAQAWANLLCDALGFEERYYFAPRLNSARVKRDDERPAIDSTEAEDSKAFHKIVGPRLSRARDFIQTNVDTSDLEISERFRKVQERLNRAQRAAKRAFRETLYSSESENQP